MPAVIVIKLIIEPDALFPDFFGLWTFGRFVLTHAPASIYDTKALSAFQGVLGMPVAISSYPFPYPPWILLLLTPVGALPYADARIFWPVATFAAYAAALAAWRWKPLLAALLVVAPSSAICFLTGQNGFLSAALMLGGLRLLHTRPLVAGALLAALGYKPQLAILVPFVLLFGQHWRAMAGAALMAAALTLATVAVFGIDIWIAWLDTMRGQAAALTTGRSELLDMMPTVTSTLLLLGGSGTLAHLAQAMGSILGIAALWLARARQDPEALIVMPLATMIATPYAFHYDCTMVTGAALAVIWATIEAGRGFGPLKLPALLACIVAPAISISRAGVLDAAVPAIFALTLWLVTRPAMTRSARSTQEV